MTEPGEVLAHCPAGVFVQVHRSTAVDVDRVAEVRMRGGDGAS